MSSASSTRPTILIQLDTDPQPSVFDAVVAVDAGVSHLFRHGGVTPENVRDLVYGALFTRGPADLHRTALFIGGSKVAAGETLLEAVRKTFFGPFQVSVLFDVNGSNTTAAAAVLTALRAVGQGGSLKGAHVLTLAATGPVGQRIARLVGRLGASVAIGSRDLNRASILADQIRGISGGDVIPFDMNSADDLRRQLETATVVINSGPAGVRLLPQDLWQGRPQLKALIDLNAVPPLGIEGVESTDNDKERAGVRAWGALGVGGIKMKIHKKAIQRLFTDNHQILDAEEVLEIGQSLS